MRALRASSLGFATGWNLGLALIVVISMRVILQADLMESWCVAERAYYTTVSVDEYPGGVLLSSLSAHALLF